MHNPMTIDYHAGDGRPLDFVLYDEDPSDPGRPDLTKPLDLSAATAIRFGVAAAATAAVPAIDKSLGSGITVVTGPEGEENVIRVALTKAETKALATGRLYFEIEVVEAGDDWTGPHGVFRVHASLLK